MPSIHFSSWGKHFRFNRYTYSGVSRRPLVYNTQEHSGIVDDISSFMFIYGFIIIIRRERDEKIIFFFFLILFLFVFQHDTAAYWWHCYSCVRKNHRRHRMTWHWRPVQNRVCCCSFTVTFAWRLSILSFWLPTSFYWSECVLCMKTIFCLPFPLSWPSLCRQSRSMKQFAIFHICHRYTYNGSVFPPGLPDHVTCPKFWWRNMLYIQTWYPFQQLCMIWSWYLADDMQFYVWAIVLLILAKR